MKSKNSIFTYEDEDISVHHLLDTNPQQSKFTMHTHDYIELYYFISGDAIFHVEGNTYPLQSGDTLVFRHAESHYVEVQPNTPYERITIHIFKDLFAPFDSNGALLQALYNRNLGQFNLYRCKNESQSPYCDFFYKIATPISNQRFHILGFLLLLLAEINSNFKDNLQKQEEEPTTFLHQIINYINLHLCEPLSLDDIAKKFYISKPQLCRIFKKSTGSMVWNYITTKRLLYARDLLATGFSAAEVCYTCGFMDYSSFYRAYVKYFGVTPISHKAREN